jgi:sporulation protein YlmC with PRC-barrel domain
MAKARDIRRDHAGVGPDPSEGRRRLVSIDDLSGYTVAKGEPDVRGWEVCTLGGRELGEVEDLLIDPDRGEVVMLEVELSGESGFHAEVPIRSVQIDRKRKVVLVDSGDISDGVRHDKRARDRMDADERENIRGAYRDTRRDVRYGERVEHDELRSDHSDADRNDVDRGDVDRGDVDRGDAGRNDGTEEHVIERRPMVEEVVVRRRPVDE